jgi:hypothetical protein
MGQTVQDVRAVLRPKLIVQEQLNLLLINRRVLGQVPPVWITGWARLKEIE